MEKQIKYKDFIKGLFLQPFEKLDHTSPLAYMENLFNIKLETVKTFHYRKERKKEEKKRCTKIEEKKDL